MCACREREREILLSLLYAHAHFIRQLAVCVLCSASSQQNNNKREWNSCSKFLIDMVSVLREREKGS